MMDHLTRRYDDLLLAKSKLVDNSALFATLKSKNLGTPAIEECLRKLHENQNISENTMKPYRRELLSDKIKEVEKNLELNQTVLRLVRERIHKIITFDPNDSEEVIREAKKNAEIWHKHKEEYRKTLNIIYNKNKKERFKRIKELTKKYKGNKKHSKNKNKITKIGNMPKSNPTPRYSIKNLEDFEVVKKQLTEFYKNLADEPEIYLDQSPCEIPLPIKLFILFILYNGLDIYCQSRFFEST